MIYTYALHIERNLSLNIVKRRFCCEFDFEQTTDGNVREFFLYFSLNIPNLRKDGCMHGCKVCIFLETFVYITYITIAQNFYRHFRDPNWVQRIENRVPKNAL